MSTSNIDQSLRRIRIRRYVTFGLWAAYLPFIAALSSVVRSGKALTVVALIYLCLFMAATIVYGFSRCPRCRKLFFVSWRLSNPFSSRCLHCGLPVSGE